MTPEERRPESATRNGLRGGLAMSVFSGTRFSVAPDGGQGEVAAATVVVAATSWTRWVGWRWSACRVDAGQSEMRGLVTAGPDFRYGADRFLKSSVIPLGGNGIAHSPDADHSKARADTVSQSPSWTFMGRGSRRGRPATSTSRPVRGRWRRWRPRGVSCGRQNCATTDGGAGCRHDPAPAPPGAGSQRRRSSRLGRYGKR